MCSETFFCLFSCYMYDGWMRSFSSLFSSLPSSPFTPSLPLCSPSPGPTAQSDPVASRAQAAESSRGACCARALARRCPAPCPAIRAAPPTRGAGGRRPPSCRRHRPRAQPHGPANRAPASPAPRAHRLAVSGGSLKPYRLIEGRGKNYCDGIINLLMIFFFSLSLSACSFSSFLSSPTLALASME